MGKACLSVQLPAQQYGVRRRRIDRRFHQDLCNDLLRAFVVTPVVHKRRCTRELSFHKGASAACGRRHVRLPRWGRRFPVTRDPGLLARNGVAWLVYERKAQKKNERAAEEMVAEAEAASK